MKDPFTQKGNYLVIIIIMLPLYGFVVTWEVCCLVVEKFVYIYTGC